VAGGANIRAGGVFIEINARADAALGVLREFSAGLDHLAAKARDAGLVLSGLATAIAVPLGLATKEALKFEQQIANVSGLLESTDMAEGYRSGILELSEQFGESTDTLAVGLYNLLSAGVPASKALQALAVSARLGRIGLTDSATAIDALTTVMNSYGISADKAARVSDIFIKTQDRGKTTVAQFAPEIGQVAAIAAQAGVSLEELGAAIATVTYTTGKTDISITALRGMLSEIVNPTNEAKELMEKLGVGFSYAELQSKGLYNVMKGLQGLPIDAITRLFPDVRSRVAVSSILQNLDRFREDLDIMGNSAGASAKKFEIAFATDAFRVEQATAAIARLRDAIGTALAPAVGRAAVVLRAAVGVAREWAEANGDTIRTVAVLTAGVAALGVALLASAAGFTALGVAASVLFNVLSAVKAIALAVFGMPGAVVLLAVAFLALGDAISEAFGYGSLGVADFLRAIRVGGQSVGAWTDAVLADARYMYAEMEAEAGAFKDRFVNGFAFIGRTVQIAFLQVIRSVVEALGKMTTATINAVATVATSMGSLGLISEETVAKVQAGAVASKLNIEDNRRALSVQIVEAATAREAALYASTATVKDRQAELARLREVRDEAQRLIFQADAGKPGAGDLAGDYAAKMKERLLAAVDSFTQETGGIGPLEEMKNKLLAAVDSQMGLNEAKDSFLELADAAAKAAGGIGAPAAPPALGNALDDKVKGAESVFQGGSGGRGIFSGFAAGALGGDPGTSRRTADAAERTAKASERTVTLLEQISLNGGGSFE